MNRRRAAQFWVALLLLLFAVACGGSSFSSGTPTSSVMPSPALPTATPAATLALELPVRDLMDLARRFHGYNGPDLARETPFNYKIGDREQFMLIELDTAQPYTITASVRAITAHAYFFVQTCKRHRLRAGVPRSLRSQLRWRLRRLRRGKLARPAERPLQP